MIECRIQIGPGLEPPKVHFTVFYRLKEIGMILLFKKTRPHRLNQFSTFPNNTCQPTKGPSIKDVSSEGEGGWFEKLKIGETFKA